MASKNLKGITIEIGGNTTKLSQAMSDAEKESRKVTNELKEIDKALKLDPGNVTLLQQKSELLAQAVEKAKDKVDVLRNSQAQIEEQFRRGDLGEEQYRAFQRELVTAEAELRDVEQAVKDEGKAQDEANPKIEAGKKSFELLAAGATAAVAAIGAAVGAAVKASEEMSNSYDTIVKKTGATGDALQELKDTVDDVFTSIPTTADDAATAVGEVNTRFAVTGDALKDLSIKFIEFAEINDTDLNNSIGITDKIMEQWGVSIDNTGNLLGLITSKAQETGISVDTLMQSVQENGATFKEMDLSLEESISLVSSFEKEGINAGTALAGLKKSVAKLQPDMAESAENAQKNADSLKELEKKSEDLRLKILKAEEAQAGYNEKTKESTKLQNELNLSRYRDELAETEAEMSDLQNAIENTDVSTKSISESMKDAIGAIKNAESETEALSIATEMFGTKGALEMTNAIREGRFSLDELGTSMSDYGNIVGDTYENTLSPIEKLKTTGNEVKEGLAEVGTAILEEVMPSIEELQPVISDIIKGLKEKIPDIKEAVKDVIGTVKEIISYVIEHKDSILTALSAIGAGFLAFNVTQMISNLVSTLQMLPTVLTAINAALMGNPVQLVITAIAALIAALIYLWNNCDEFRNFILGVFDVIKKAIKTLWEYWKDGAEQIKQIFDNVKKFFSSTWEIMKGGFTGFTSFISGKFTSNFSKAFEVIKSIFDAVKNHIENRIKLMTDIFMNIIDFVKNVFTGNWSGAWDNIKNIFKDVWASFVDYAKAPLNIILGLVNGVIGGINKLIDGINGISVSIPEWVPKIGGNSIGFSLPHVPEIPMLAEGGILSSGSAIVGEAGAELLTVMNGKAVVQPLTTNNTSSVVSGDTIVNVIINNPQLSSRYDTQRLGQDLKFEMQRELAGIGRYQ